jgi:anti-sigma-K factor RskA
MIPAERLEQAAAYALGALATGEIAGFEAELAKSEELRREVDEMRRVGGYMALAAPAVPVPAKLRDRILSQARSVTTPIAARRDERSAESHPPTSRWTAARVAPWLVAAAASVGFVIMWSRYTFEHDARVAATQASDSARSELAARDSLLAVLLAPDVETAKLVSTGRPPSARLYWNRAKNEVILAAFSLPPAPSGRAYQLWGIAGANAKPVSLGVFNTTSLGEGRLSAKVPEGLTIAVGAVTEEPAGGSPQPTTQPFLVGQIRVGAQ